MQLIELLRAIRSTGRIEVDKSFDVERDGLDDELRALDELVRIDGPADLPELDTNAAAWAVERLHAACVLLVHRDLDATAVEQHVLAPFPGDARAPTSHYGVDLSFRYLPDLWQLARHVAPDDPLVAALRHQARQWPLSSVGLTGLDKLSVEPILANAGLLRLYVDRILRLQDESRAKDERVAQAIEAAIGEHRDFARSVLDLHDQITRGRGSES